MIRALVAPALIIFAITPVYASDIGENVGSENHIVYLNGPIQSGDASKFYSVLTNSYRKSTADKKLVLIDLSSPGGVVEEAKKMAALVKEGNFPVLVLKSSECASACFIIFLASPFKIAWHGARIGVHSVSIENGRETASTKETTVDFARYAKDSGAPDSVVGKLVTTKPNDIMFLSDEELKSMKVTFMDDAVDKKSIPSVGFLPQLNSPRTTTSLATPQPANEVVVAPHTIKPENWKSCAVGDLSMEENDAKDWEAIPEWTKAPHLKKIYVEPRTLALHGLCNEKFKRIVLCLPGGARDFGTKKVYTDEDWVCDAVLNKRM